MCHHANKDLDHKCRFVSLEIEMRLILLGIGEPSGVQTYLLMLFDNLTLWDTCTRKCSHCRKGTVCFEFCSPGVFGPNRNLDKDGNLKVYAVKNNLFKPLLLLRPTSYCGWCIGSLRSWMIRGTIHQKQGCKKSIIFLANELMD